MANIAVDCGGRERGQDAFSAPDKVEAKCRPGCEKELSAIDLHADALAESAHSPHTSGEKLLQQLLETCNKS